MLNFKNLLVRALLAFAMASGAGAALAGPTYHVDVDTSALAGNDGYLDFLFSAQGNAAFTSATLSHFTGNFSGDTFASGGASGSAAAGGAVSTTDAWNELGLLASFGGHFGFDVSFAQATDNLIGSLFEVALLGADLNYLAPTVGDIAQFQLLPGAAVGLQASDFATISIVSDVPEPAEWMLMLTGLALLGLTLRRRA